MTRDAKLKIAAGLSTVVAGALGGLALGPVGAAAGAAGALATFLMGLYHQTPPPRQGQASQDAKQ